MAPTLLSDVAANDLELIPEKLSGDLNVPDPVAVSIDPAGNVYVAATTRRKAADLDIRQHTDWIAADVGLESVEEKEAFLKEQLAPGKLKTGRGDLADHNGDGSVDWKDLTVHSERIYQLRDEDGDGIADRITVFAEGFNTVVTGIAAGILYHDGWVYVTIAPDLWRLRDTDDDGVADEREVVAHGFGNHIAYAGHDMHGPTVGPDGRIYWSIGDKGLNVVSKEGERHAYPHEGAVMRVEPDGSGFEVFAHGLRNVQEVAFDAWGQMFGVDNDADMKGEKERLVRIVEGSDSGWTCAHQYMSKTLGRESRWMRERIWELENEAQPLRLLPPLAHSRNGPAGFLWEPGTALNEAFRGRFLLDQFPSGEISALQVERQGATFLQTAEDQVHSGLKGIGMSWAPDGSFLIADWDGGYPLDGKGAVWRMDVREETRNEEQRADTRKRLTQDWTEVDEGALLEALGHADQRVRLAAQFELVDREAFAQLETVALDSEMGELPRLHALWGAGQGLRKSLHPAAGLMPLAQDAVAVLRANLAKVLGDAGSTSSEFGLGLVPLLTDPDPEVRLQSSIAVGKLKVTQALEPLLHQAAVNGRQPVLRHGLAMALAGSAGDRALMECASDDSWGVRAVALQALGYRESEGVSAFLGDEDPRIADEAVRWIHDDGGMPTQWAELMAWLPESADRSEVIQDRLVNTAYRLGGPEGAEALVEVVLDPDRPEKTRGLAARLLGAWRQPPVLDLVDGTANSYSGHVPSGVMEAIKPHVDALLALEGAQLEDAVLEMLLELEVRIPDERLIAMMRDKALEATRRAHYLRLLANQTPDHPELGLILTEFATQASDEALFLEALQVGSRRPELPFVDWLRDRYAEADGILRQKLLSVASQSEPVTPELVNWAEELAEALSELKVKPPVLLDVLEFVRSVGSESDLVAEGVETFTSKTAVRGYPAELLWGGDRSRGKDLVHTHLAANCIACHRVESQTGSTVGPALGSIGETQPREKILLSLIQPAAELAEGYAMVTLQMADGETLSGTLIEESEDRLSIKLGEGNVRDLDRSEILSQSPPISVMPPMLGILTPREVRDVVAYLAGLKGRK